MLRHLRVALSFVLFAVLGGLGPSAYADGSYLWYYYPSTAYGPMWDTYSSNVNDALSAKPSNCQGPSGWDAGANTTIHATSSDPNGTTFYLPVYYSGCVSDRGVLIGDGYKHTGNTMWGVTYCGAGYAPFKQGAGWQWRCQPNSSAAAAADEINEQGLPPDGGGGICSASLWKGDPVNAANGNEHMVEHDYAGAGGNLLSLSRLYNSGAGFAASSFGSGWRHSLEYRALVGDASGSTVVLVRPDGSSLKFVYDTTSAKYIGPDYVRGALTPTFSNGNIYRLTFTREDGTKELYSNTGMPISITFGQGGVLTFSTSGNSIYAVSDGRGHSISFTQANIAGAVRNTKIAVAGVNYVYGYDTYGRLTGVTYPTGETRSYQYLPWLVNGAENPLRYRLTNVIDGLGSTYATITYDSQGRATSTKHGTNAELTTFSYGSNSGGSGSTVVTSPLGVAETMLFAGAGSSTKPQTQSSTKSCAGCGASGTLTDSFAYDSRGNFSVVADRQGLTTCYDFDQTRNLPLKVVEGVPQGVACSAALTSPPANARVQTVQWHALFAVPMAITGPQLKVLFNYDSFGRKLFQTEVETNDATGAAGSSAQTVGTARTTTWTYNSQGSVLTVKEPRTDVNATTTFAYDGNQNLLSITSPVGLVTTLGNYDGNGRPGLITHPNGLQTTLSYDARGRTTQVATGGKVTSYGYNAAGLLATATLPSGVGLTFTYDDAHRLIATQDSLGNRVDQVLDGQGNVVQETVTGNGGAVALARQAAYDQLSRMTSLVKAQ